LWYKGNVARLMKSTWIPLISILALFLILVAEKLIFRPSSADLNRAADYVGQTYNGYDSWGESCEMHDSAPVVSSTKIAAQVRETACSPDPTSGTVHIFVFVRPISAKNSLDNLVLRLEEGDNDSGHMPEVSWIRAATLRIVVWDNDYWIERQLNRILGVKIEYRFYVRPH
jgi:hypothetical protein